MDIGDWEVEQTREVEIIMEPGNVSSPKQHLVTYSFIYKPTNRELIRTIHYIKNFDSSQRLEFLTNFVPELKSEFIDFLDVANP